MSSLRTEAQLLAWYQEKIASQTASLHQLNRRISLFSWLRLTGFFLLVALTAVFALHESAVWLFLALVSFVTLIVLIVTHQKIYTSRDRVAVLLSILQNELNNIHGDGNFYADGLPFAQRLPFADDLDLFGPHSLFHQLNRCTTSFGQSLLAEALIHGAREKDRIVLLQEAIAELADDMPFNQEIQQLFVQAYAARDHREPNASRENILLFNHKAYAFAVWFLPLAVMASLVIWITTASAGLFILFSTASLFTAFAQNRKMSLLSEETSGIGHSIQAYHKALSLLKKRTNRAPVLHEMESQALEAIDALKELEKIAAWFDRRANVLLYLAGNMLLASDLLLALRYENWKNKHFRQMEEWLMTAGRLEMLISLAVFRHNSPGFCTPVVAPQIQIKAEALGHPLIPAAKRVNNDLNLQVDPRIVLVTGSNMSGKSTWLRTLGLNVILAQTGTVVCAKAFSWRPMPVLSSLRQTDSLHENTSLFMQELKQLKRILEKALRPQPCLILLDEVLRGTNSDDKYSGSEALIKRFYDCNSLVVMATHDLKLSSLEQSAGGKVTNQCFESQITGGQLIFDYKIRPGVAVNRNATWLMQEMGIIKTVDPN